MGEEKLGQSRCRAELHPGAEVTGQRPAPVLLVPVIFEVNVLMGPQGKTNL